MNMKFCANKDCKYWEYDFYNTGYKTYCGKPGVCKLNRKCEDTFSNSTCKNYHKKVTAILHEITYEVLHHGSVHH